jgi:uncharacterized membrane-anchored protein
MEKIMNIDATTIFVLFFGMLSLVMFWINKLLTNQGIKKSNTKYFIVLGMAFVLVISVTFFNVLIPTYLLQLAFVFLALILII